MESKLELLVKVFADNVIVQIESDSVVKGNRAAKRYINAWKQLTLEGDEGRESLAVLLLHPHPRVRITAAAFLLRYKNSEAKAVLIDIIQNQPDYALEAKQCLKNWENGTWQLDPEQ